MRSLQWYKRGAAYILCIIFNDTSMIFNDTSMILLSTFCKKSH